MPSTPNGRKGDAPTASVGGMSVRLAASSSGIAATAKTTSPTTAIAVITNMTFSASPMPERWIAMKIRYAAR